MDDDIESLLPAEPLERPFQIIPHEVPFTRLDDHSHPEITMFGIHRLIDLRDVEASLVHEGGQTGDDSPPVGAGNQEDGLVMRAHVQVLPGLARF